MPTDPVAIRDDELAPVDFIVVEFPQGAVTAAGFDRLLDLADRGVVQILDVEFLAKGADGAVTSVALGDLSLPAGVDLRAWDGAASGLLDAEDVEQLGAELQPGSIAVVVVFENRWVLDVVDAWRHHGARLVADGGLPAGELVAALDTTDR